MVHILYNYTVYIILTDFVAPFPYSNTETACCSSELVLLHLFISMLANVHRSGVDSDGFLTIPLSILIIIGACCVRSLSNSCQLQDATALGFLTLCLAEVYALISRLMVLASSRTTNLRYAGLPTKLPINDG